MNGFRRIIFVSNESKNDYLDLYPKHKDKSLVFNNFVDIESILSKSNDPVEINKPKNKKLFVFVGRLEESSKKITRLIDIANNINNIAIWIIGDGKDRKLYEQLIKNNNLEKKINMLGSIKEPYNYMKKADYIILTSDYEGFPVVYLEALVLNKEIISTIPVSDEHLDFKEIAHIISKDNYVEDVRKVLKKEEKKSANVNLKEAQYQRKKKLEKLFEGVI
jgi:glycosyltransferase involved in cell wall biosynthesis